MNATTPERLAEVRRRVDELRDRLANVLDDVGGAWLEERESLAATLDELAEGASELADRLRRND